MSRKISGDGKLENVHLEDITMGVKETTHVEGVYIDSVADKKLLRKLDLHVLPPLFLLFLLAFLDRTNIGKVVCLNYL